MTLITFVLGLFLGVLMKEIIRIMETEFKMWHMYHEERQEATQNKKLMDIWGNAYNVPVEEEPSNIFWDDEDA